jgi:hypothetical protein
MMTSRSLIRLLENQNGGKLQKYFLFHQTECKYRYSLSSERLVDIKVIKFFVEQGVACARKI